MATGLDNLWIYKLAEDLEIKVHEVTKKFPKDEIFRSVGQYTVLLKGTNAYIRFLKLNDLQNQQPDKP